MQVSSDKEALQLMNDSPYGLTASVWTNAEKKPGVRKGVLEVRGWIGDRNRVPESVRLSM